MHPLKRLEGGLGDEFRVRVALKQLKESEQSYFQIFISNRTGAQSDQPVFEGVYSSGIKPYIDGWIDGQYYEQTSFRKTRINLSELGLDIKLFRKLGGILKPGWSLMVAYEMFWGKGESLEETSRGLNNGIPPMATSLGYLLFNAGCLKVKDWYIPEGGLEGAQKLEGLRPVNRRHAGRMLKESKAELLLFLRKKNHGSGLEAAAMERTRKILGLIREKEHLL